MEEDIKLVENLIEEYKMFGDLDGIQDLKPYMESLEHLIKAYKKLEEEKNKYLINLTDEQYRKLVDIIRKDINKEWTSKIKEKIEEIDKEIEYQKLYGNVSKREELETKKEHFLELLEGE